MEQRSSAGDTVAATVLEADAKNVTYFMTIPPRSASEEEKAGFIYTLTEIIQATEDNTNDTST